MDDEKLVKKVAEAIFAERYGDNNPTTIHFRATLWDMFEAFARSAIAAVRAHDIERAQTAIDAYMSGYDPDDYTHPLSLTVGPRHTRGGLTSG